MASKTEPDRKKLVQRTRDDRDKAIIEENAERLNREAADVLDYQKVRWMKRGAIRAGNCILNVDT